ncbi:LysR family transcriptional regulator, partial [Achromobacter aegrifaciens]|uniref:LysR family transcriptional regulator n=1 Tax=Achromobacter aegrifaciens TaxID=1287736 RepID=UPI001FCC6D3D
MQINLSMRDIDTTLVLGRTLNFRQAAAQLHLSQSALSTQIQRIEEALGVRLFDRTTRTVRLTAAGEVFMQQAAALQVAFRDAIAAVSGIVNAEQGQVSVAALPSIAARLLPRVLMTYRQAHPLVALKVRDTLSGPAFDLVRAGGGGGGPPPPAPPPAGLRCGPRGWAGVGRVVAAGPPRARA